MYSPSAAILTRGGREGREEMETIYAAACCCYMTVLHIVNGEVIHILSSGCTSLTAAVTKGTVTRECEWQAGMWENQEILFFFLNILKMKNVMWGEKRTRQPFFLYGKIHILSPERQLRRPHTTQHQKIPLRYNHGYFHCKRKWQLICSNDVKDAKR